MAGVLVKLKLFKLRPIVRVNASYANEPMAPIVGALAISIRRIEQELLDIFQLKCRHLLFIS